MQLVDADDMHADLREEFRSVNKLRSGTTRTRADLRAAMHLAEEARPGRGIALQELVRRVVRKTPYLVVYAVLPDQIVVLAIAHTRRVPGYWRDRLATLG